MPVPLDSLTIGFLVDELDRLLRGREIRGIGIDEGRIAVITFADTPEELWFLFDTTFPLLALEAKPRGKPAWEHAARFEEPLRGARVAAVEQLGLERVIRLSTGAEGGRAHHLYFELTPPLPNLFLTGADQKVEAVLLRAGTKTRKRTVEQGAAYPPPEAAAKLSPLAVKSGDLEGLPWQRDHDALSKAIQGISPFTSREIVARAAGAGDIVQAYREFIEDYQARRPHPCVFRVGPALAKRPPLVGIAWYRPRIEGVSEIRPAPSVNAAAAAAFHAFLRASAADLRRAEALNAISRARARWQAVARGAREAIERRPTAGQYRRFADLILANPKSIVRGAGAIRLPDIYSESGAEAEVPLDPRLAAHANADAYFKKARRIERSASMAEEALRNARRHLDGLEAIRAEAEAADTTLARLKQLAQDAGGETAPKEREEKTDALAATLGIKPRRFVVAGGWTVLVGRSAAENDVLTHRYARPGDLWFHARQAQGSHVVLRKDRQKAEPPREAIIEAARLAAHYSKAKTSKHVPVSYTERRYVKKVRGAPAGTAAMLREKVVFVTPAAPRDDQAA